MVSPSTNITYLGVLPPPPGYTPNFDNPQSRQAPILVGNILCIIAALLATGIRLGTRHFVSRSIGLDDYLCVVATLFVIGQSVTLFNLLKVGLGIHKYEILLSSYNYYGWVEENVVALAMHNAAMSTVKLAILALYLRLFSSSGKLFRYAVFFMIFCVLTAFLTLEGLLFFSCRPLKKVFRPLLPGTCMDYGLHIKAQLSQNIATNVIIMLLPLPIIWKLQVNIWQRAAIISIFLSGFFVCGISILRLKQLFGTFTADSTWEQCDSTFWSPIEATVALVCCCAPTFRPAISSALHWTSSLTSKFSSKTSLSKNTTKQSADPSSSKGSSNPSTKASTTSYADKDNQWDTTQSTESRMERGTLEYGEKGKSTSVITTGPAKWPLDYPSADSNDHVSPLPGIVKTTSIQVAKGPSE
ncbi:MAG: hypothetical protein M1829_005588 [Trizodia sp. TS-e1964]|nr:MAG: hypothetical protein M1829_005588 [Trizodia sp. TS-e1964]